VVPPQDVGRWGCSRLQTNYQVCWKSARGKFARWVKFVGSGGFNASRLVPLGVDVVREVVEVRHPVAQHHLSILRDQQTGSSLFRSQSRRLATLLAAAATSDLAVRPKRVQTPLAEMEGSELAARIAIVPILRAGLGLVEPILEMLPDAEVWHLGMYRDEATAQPVEYYCKLPREGGCDIAFVLDPMLATGGSAISAIEALTRWGCPEIRLLSILAARPGVERLQAQFPSVGIYVCAIDPELNAHNFIVPGLGDAGDRIFNTRG
jgi:uracil phosphoribosyltransferase